MCTVFSGSNSKKSLAGRGDLWGKKGKEVRIRLLFSADLRYLQVVGIHEVISWGN